VTAPAPDREKLLALIVEQIELMRRFAGHDDGYRPRARWLLKEAVYWIWELPQLKEPRLGKYSLHMPWSPNAHDRLTGWQPGHKPRPSTEGLRFEHIIPRGLLAEELLRETPPDLADFLDTHFQAAVLTVADDHQLNQAGVRARMPGGWTLGDDPWDRYRAAGLIPEDFVVPVARLAAAAQPPAA
jgi:hypothetical protein